MFRLLIRELCDVLPPQLLKYSFVHKVQIKEKFGEFENVLLSADELQKLKSKLGAETESYIERLSSYIASSGKKYKSHYATILSWTQKDTKSFGGVDHGRSGRKLCTEYPE